LLPLFAVPARRDVLPGFSERLGSNEASLARIKHEHAHVTGPIILSGGRRRRPESKDLSSYAASVSRDAKKNRPFALPFPEL